MRAAVKAPESAISVDAYTFSVGECPAAPLFTFNFRSSHNIYRKYAHLVSSIHRASRGVIIPVPRARHLS